MNTLPTLSDRSFNRNPFKNLQHWQRQVDRIFDRLWSNEDLQTAIEPLNAPSFAPSCDAEETKTHYLMSFDLPGVKKEDIKIDLSNNILTVSGERKEEREEKKRGDYRSECFYGKFERSFSLPAGVKAERIETNYADGVLQIAVPKSEELQSQSIKIAEGKPGFMKKFLGQSKDEAKKAQAH